MVIKSAGTANGLFTTNERAAFSQTAPDRKSNGKTIFAGDMKKMTDTISVKREQAQKRALKIVGDVFDGEKSIDRDMQAMLDKCEELRDERLAYKESIAQIGNERGNLMELYGVSTDSEEYENLELLRKEKESKNLTSGIELTDEEKDKLAQIHEAGITDFQKEMLSLDESVKEYEGKIAASEQAIQVIQKSWADMKIERLKSDPMVEASEQAEEIMLQANQEIIGELRKEAVEHVEEKLEETVDAAKEQAEKKEEEQEKLEEQKEKQKELEKTIEKAKESSDSTASNNTVRHDVLEVDMDAITSYNSGKNKIDQELEKIMDELNLIMEDLKGAEVDVNL